MKEQIVLEDGKYTFINDNGLISVLRYGEEWKNFHGDKSVYALFAHAYELQEKKSVPEYIDNKNKQFSVGDKVSVQVFHEELIGTVSFTTEDFVEVQPVNGFYVRGPFPNKLCKKL